jgi:hypothetical protein
MGIGIVLKAVMVILIIGLLGASFSRNTSKSWCRPLSSSFIKTLDVICMALHKSRPSYSALIQAFFYFRSNIHKGSP